jgi:hypothetical protein
MHDSSRRQCCILGKKVTTNHQGCPVFPPPELVTHPCGLSCLPSSSHDWPAQHEALKTRVCYHTNFGVIGDEPIAVIFLPLLYSKRIEAYPNLILPASNEHRRWFLGDFPSAAGMYIPPKSSIAGLSTKCECGHVSGSPINQPFGKLAAEAHRQKDTMHLFVGCILVRFPLESLVLRWNLLLTETNGIHNTSR